MERKELIQFRVDKSTKEKTTKLFNELGIDMSKTLNMFLKQTIIEQSIPFKATLLTSESFKARNDFWKIKI
jgi:DNA-damage-inducible protein J